MEGPVLVTEEEIRVEATGESMEVLLEARPVEIPFHVEELVVGHLVEAAGQIEHRVTIDGRW